MVYYTYERGCVSQHVATCCDMLQHSTRHILDTQRHKETQRHVFKCLHRRNVVLRSNCGKTYGDTVTCPRHVTICHNMSFYCMWCRLMSRHIFIRHTMLECFICKFLYSASSNPLCPHIFSAKRLIHIKPKITPSLFHSTRWIYAYINQSTYT